MPDHRFAAVVLDQGVKKPLDYAIPAEWQHQVEIGSRVEVPLRSGLSKATIISLKPSSSIANPKSIARILRPESALHPSQWQLAEWMAAYYCTPMQKVLKCFIPPSLRKEAKQKKEVRLCLSLTREKASQTIALLRTEEPIHAAILEKLLEAAQGRKASELMQELSVSRSPIETLVKKKWIEKKELSPDDLDEAEFFPSQPKTLTQEQAACLQDIRASLDQNKYGAHLIQGVTGSGKTEIYLQAIALALAQGRSAIMLVPEISLTSQTIERFRARFQEKIAIWHHKRSLGERTTAWEQLKSGKAQIVVGARSAIFCPIQNVGLIIVDEEHDSSYKQSEEPPCYQGRDVAVKRAHIEGAVVLLGSATPSIESKHNAENGKYRLNQLFLRANSSLLPKVTIVDMNRALDINGGFTHFSSELIEAMKTRIEAGEQTLLFLNKRGYHRLQVCASCQHTIKCPHCDLALTFHKADSQLKCHLCNHSQPLLPACPNCSSRESLQFRGFGTEHVERSLHALLPGVRTLRMDKDTTQKKTSHEELYKQFRAHKADVLIGTQMIAKGFHFPAATLVGVLNTDAALNIPDFRSAEQVFQLVTQVAGRAGRSELPGEVILQTFLPDHPILKLAAKQDYEAFYSAELAERRLFSYPPFCRLAKVVLTGKDPLKTETLTTQLQTRAKLLLGGAAEVLPPLPSGHPKIKDRYRYQFIIKTPKISSLQLLVPLLQEYPDCKIDIDPVSTFF